MSTRYDRMREAARAVEILVQWRREDRGDWNAYGDDLANAEQLRADADELERAEQDARNLAFHHDDAAFDGLADRIRGEK